MNPVLEILGQYGYMNVAYIENSLLLKDTDDECIENVQNTNDLMLGRVCNSWKKICFQAVIQIAFFGNIVESVSMTVVLPKEKDCIRISES